MNKLIVYWIVISLLEINANALVWVDENILKDNLLKNPNDLNSRLIYARFLMEHNEISKAEALLHQTKQIDPKSKKLLKEIDKRKKNLILINRRMPIVKKTVTSSQVKSKKYTKAKKKSYSRKTVSKMAENKQYTIDRNRAFSLRWAGDIPQSRDLFRKLHQQNPADSEVAEEVMIDEKNFSPLISMYEKKLRKDPDNIVALEKISYLLQLDEQYVKALFYLKKLYDKTKKNVLLPQIADVALKMKDIDSGLFYWETYAKQSDTDLGWLDYGKNLNWAGRHDQAIIILSKISDDSNVSVEAKRLREEIQAYLQEKERIAAFSTQTTKEVLDVKEIITIMPDDSKSFLRDENLKMDIMYNRLRDSDGLQMNYHKIRSVYKNSHGVDLKAEVGHYYFRNGIDSFNGLNSFFSVGDDTIEIGAQIDTIENKTSILPYLRLMQKRDSHFFTLIASQRNVGFIKNALVPLRDNNILTSLQLTDYVEFSNKGELWASVDLSRDKYNNTIVTPQFNYRFWKKELLTYTLSTSLEGWYMANTKPSEDYYSPKKYDSTYMSASVTVPLSAYMTFDVMGGIGNSFESDVLLYKAGIWLNHSLKQGLSFRLGCSDNRAKATSSINKPYKYDLCDANLHYQW